MNGKKTKLLKLTVLENIRGGVYCNNRIFTHSKEEFMMDFMFTGPLRPIVNARVIMSPRHLKRTNVALKYNLDKN